MMYVNVDEAGDNIKKNDAQALKSLITEPTKTIKLKNIGDREMPDFTNFVLTGNVVPKGMVDLSAQDDRRFFVIQANEKHKQDKDYFEVLIPVLESKEVQYNFYLFLKGRDLSAFNVGDIPMTPAKLSILKDSTFSGLVFLEDLISNSVANKFNVAPDWQTSSWTVSCEGVFNSYLSSPFYDAGQVKNQNDFTKKLSDALGECSMKPKPRKLNGSNVRTWKFKPSPDLKTLLIENKKWIVEDKVERMVVG